MLPPGGEGGGLFLTARIICVLATHRPTIMQDWFQIVTRALVTHLNSTAMHVQTHMGQMHMFCNHMCISPQYMRNGWHSCIPACQPKLARHSHSTRQHDAAICVPRQPEQDSPYRNMQLVVLGEGVN